MKIPSEPWIQMVILSWGILVLACLPLLILIPIWRHQGKKVSTMWVKYIAWYIMVPLVTLPMFLGRIGMQIAFLIMALFAFEEYARAVGLWQKKAHVWLARLSIGLIFYPVFVGWYNLFAIMPGYVIILIFFFPVIRDRYQGMIQCSCLSIVGVIYFGWFLGHLAYLMNIPSGRALILAFFLIVVINDSTAYLVGSTIGRHKMAPNISPNKTWEGFTGALVITMLMVFAVRFALDGITPLHTVFLGLIFSLGGTCGDLVISMIKRDVNIKDSGKIIPGHGGLLDRLDSILFTAPLFFHFMNYFYDIVTPPR